ncbi:hypothetical protein M2360_000175 [Rhizobium sp. SG_E_25_P2]|uniref:hypothetical protein n=1 Tax=Rhizobium sp. SG_E_25_P2 TaxID=2879942 RepID=UPI002476DFAF|nr:hypothetical protein [Rhizobium sp. SG_E_25_P2]MDH6264794.1 hypothetical protein [Rhizobium sp. SG_E_25_P2]
MARTRILCLAQRLAFVAAMLLAPLTAFADEADAVRERERQDYAMSCQDVKFMPEAIWTGDVNKDGLTDAIVQSASVACDNSFGVDCTALGCPIRIYIQTDDGRMAYIGQVRGFGYEISYRYGIRILEFRIAGNRCQKVNAAKCVMVVRVDGRKLVTLSTE